MTKYYLEITGTTGAYRIGGGGGALCQRFTDADCFPQSFGRSVGTGHQFGSQYGSCFCGASFGQFGWCCFEQARLYGGNSPYHSSYCHGAKLLYAYGEATVPKVTITLRKSYGGSHIVMSCKQLRGDMNYAWPTAEIAVMGGAGAVEVLYAREAKEQENPAAFLAEKEAEYTKLFANPYNAAKYASIETAIEPRNTRFRIIRALQQLQTKKLTNPAKKHGNIPL